MEIQKEMKATAVKPLKAEAKAQVKAKEFDSAIGTLNEVLDAKKARLASLKEINEIWEQIDSLIE